MPSDAADQYGFRPLTGDDLPLAARWLAMPHVARWWGDSGQALDQIAAHVALPDTVEPFVILMDGRPIGYMQSYDIHAEAGHPYQDQPVGSLGIDQFIGEAELIGKGHGPRLIDQFVRRLFEDGAPRVVIDPDPANAAAIRAYEKAGFSVIGPRTSIHGPALLMMREPHDHTRVT